MDAKTIEWIIFGPLIVGVILMSWWAMQESHKRLDDPTDDRTVYLDRLKEILKLAPQGVFRVTIFRQSGNIHAEHTVTGSAQEALNTALATFRRAGINAVHVGENSETELRIGRLYHDHRGRKEGKKVGKATISLAQRTQPLKPIASEAPEPKPVAIVAPVPEPIAEAVTEPELPVEPEPGDPRITFEYVGLTCDCGTRFELASARLCTIR